MANTTIPKQLGQLRPANTTAASIYSLPDDKQAVITAITVTNTTGNTPTFRLFHDNDGTTYDQTTAFRYDVSLAANETKDIDLRLMMRNSLGNLAVRTSAANEITFTVWGFEQDRANTVYQQQVIDLSPWGYWPLNDTGGLVALDLSGNNRHAHIFGAPTFSSTALRSDDSAPSILFNGSTQYIVLPEYGSIDFNTGTIMGWCNHSTGSLSADEYIVGRNAAGNNVGDVGLFADSVGSTWEGLWQDGTDAADVTGGTFDTNTHLIGMTWDTAGNLILYEDGIAVGTPASMAAVATDTSVLDMVIGNLSEDTATDRFWTGNLQDIAILETVVTAAQFLALYNQGT